METSTGTRYLVARCRVNPQKKTAGIPSRGPPLSRQDCRNSAAMVLGDLRDRLGDRLRRRPPDVRRKERSLLGPVPAGDDYPERLLHLGDFTDFLHGVPSVCNAQSSVERTTLKHRGCQHWQEL